MTGFLKIYLPVFLVAYLVTSFVLPSVRVYKKTGINPVTFGNTDSAHDYIGFIMKGLTGLLVVAVLLFSFSHAAYAWLVPIPYLQQEGLVYAGLFLMHASLLWIVLAQAQMRQSWRIGLDEANRTELVTHGLFRASRNPVFLGMLLSVLGIFFILPNALTFFTTLATYIIIQVQIRLEEAHLLQQHGEAYAQYKRRVRRLV